MEKRLEALKLDAQISPLQPVVLGGLLVIPAGLIAAMMGKPDLMAQTPADTQASAARAGAIIMEVERKLGFDPTDRDLDVNSPALGFGAGY